MSMFCHQNRGANLVKIWKFIQMPRTVTNGSNTKINIKVMLGNGFEIRFRIICSSSPL